MSSTTLFNIRQIHQRIFNKSPLKCHCNQCEPGMVFTCDLCDRLMPWCHGQDWSRPDTCDECRKDIQEIERVLIGGAAS